MITSGEDYNLCHCNSYHVISALKMIPELSPDADQGVKLCPEVVSYSDQFLLSLRLLLTQREYFVHIFS